MGVAVLSGQKATTSSLKLLGKEDSKRLNKGSQEEGRSHGINQVSILDIILWLRDREMLVILFQPLPSKSVSRHAEATELICLHT